MQQTLFDFDLRASFFKLFLGSIGVSFVRAFQNGLRSTFNKGFGFRQAETGFDFANRFNRSDLLVSRNRNEDHVKRVFCFRRSRSSASGAATSRQQRPPELQPSRPRPFQVVSPSQRFR